MADDAAAFEATLKSLRQGIPSNVTALSDAVRRGDLQCVREGLDTLGGQWMPSLKCEAITSNNVTILDFLLQNDPTVSDQMVRVACENQNPDIVKAFLDHGWSINGHTGMGTLPLCMAVQNEQFLSAMIRLGASVDARTKDNESVLSAAITNGSLKIVRHLMETEKNFPCSNPLHCAAERPDQHEGASIVAELISKGVNVNAWRYDNPVALTSWCLRKLPTPLHTACYQRNVPVARALLTHGANPHRGLLSLGREIEPSAYQIALEASNEMTALFQEFEQMTNASGSTFFRSVLS